MNESFSSKVRFEGITNAHSWQKVLDVMGVNALLPFAAVLHSRTAGQCEHDHNE